MPDIDETLAENDESQPTLSDPDEKFVLDPPAMEALGVEGRSFWEMRDGETASEFFDRVADKTNRDVVFLWHCYKRCGDDWLEAYRLAPALSCLGALGANKWLDDMEEEYFDAIADLLPYEGIAINLAEYEQQAADSPFFAKYSADMADVLDHLIDQFSNQGPVWALEVIYDEVRKRYVANRLMGQSSFAALDAASNELQAKDEANGMVAFGVADVDEHWQPISLRMVSKTQADDVLEAVNEMLGEEPGILEYPDDGLLEALLLQGYIWADRSWNKSEMFARDIAHGAVIYTRVMFGSDPDLGTMDPAERIKRLEELAEELRDADGKIALRVDPNKQPVRTPTSIRYEVDAESAEYMELAQQQDRFQKHAQLGNVAARYSEHLPACHDNIYALMLEEVIGCLEGVIGTDDFEKTVDDLDKYIDKRITALSAKAKSKWKKYLKANPDAAEAAKNKEPIVGLDTEDSPIFASDVVTK